VQLNSTSAVAATVCAEQDTGGEKYRDITPTLF